LESKNVARWLYAHNTALEKHGLKKEFDSIQKALQIADQAKGIELQFNKSSLAKALNVDPDKAISEVLMIGLGRKQSINKLKQMVNLSNKDTTGSATAGLKAGIGDYFNQEMRLTARDLANNKIESLAKIDKFIKNYKPALKESGLYTKEELQAFDNVHGAIIKISKQQKPHPEFGGSPTFELFSRFAASGTSIAFGHIGLYSAARGVFTIMEKPIKDRIEASVTRAIFDPRYAEAISGFAANIQKLPAQKALEIFNRRLETLGGMIGIKLGVPKESER